MTKLLELYIRRFKLQLKINEKIDSWCKKIKGGGVENV